jgi:hypothetical protein
MTWERRDRKIDGENFQVLLVVIAMAKLDGYLQEEEQKVKEPTQHYEPGPPSPLHFPFHTSQYFSRRLPYIACSNK